MRNCRVMAVVSLSFIITITPWTLRQIIAACTNSRVSRHHCCRPGRLQLAYTFVIFRHVRLQNVHVKEFEKRLWYRPVARDSQLGHICCSKPQTSSSNIAIQCFFIPYSLVCLEIDYSTFTQKTMFYSTDSVFDVGRVPLPDLPSVDTYSTVASQS